MEDGALLFDAPPSQPQSIGDLVGRAYRIYRVNIPLFVHILLWPTIAVATCKIGFHLGMTTYLKCTREQNHFGSDSGIVLTLAALAAAYVVFWLMTMRQLALVRVVNGFANTYKDAHDHMFKRGWRLHAVLILCILLGLGMVIFWIVELFISGSIVKSMGLIFLISAVLFTLLGLLVSGFLGILVSFVLCSMVACEDERLIKLVPRSFNLMFTDLGRSVLFGLLLLLTIASLYLPLTLPAVVFSGFEFFRNGLTTYESMTDPTRIPLGLVIINQFWMSLVSMLLLPVSFLSFGLFYYDLRMRQEGLDIAQNLKLLEKRNV